VCVGLLLAALAPWGGCSAGAGGGGGAGGSSTGGTGAGATGGGGAGATGGDSASSGGASGLGGSGGVVGASGGITGAAGSITSAAGGGGGRGIGGGGTAGSPGAGGGRASDGGSGGNAQGPGGGGATGLAGAGGAGGRPMTTGGGGAAGGSSNCNLPSTVSFQKDVQPFLIKSCGSSGSDGCHVIDAASTMAAGGWDHAYDWITAGAHASSCPEKPTPLRFQVVVAVIDQANPPTCSNSRQMPPPDTTGGMRTPLTTCQVATLQAWLNEPLVVQMHRADDSSPTTPYPMPPFN
jgi:hypothetical protein